MHIPDGYLSPSTCATLYAAAAPFWYVALKRIRNTLTTRTVPLLAVFAAFSFVIMMFNLPVPGGTTAHAVGMGMSAVLLGPFVSILSLSLALFIQCLFFGDGGITTFGANCFNMAILGSLSAYVVYRIISRGAEIDSPRRVIAAGFAGYVGMNVAALCAAVEFGIQPLLFREASGVPLYAPYPLSISVPAMMIGHLTFAGFAEFIVSAGVVRYVQQIDPSLLRATAPGVPMGTKHPPTFQKRPSQPAWRKLGLILGLILTLTPLGVLAVGSAWGEWRIKDLSDSAARRQIEAASNNQPLPPNLPRGLERSASLWRAPIPDYAPSFVRNRYFGYVASAAIGTGLVILLTLALTGALRIRIRRDHDESDALAMPLPPHRNGFLERSLQSVLNATRSALLAEDVAQRNGLLQGLDPRVKVAGIGALVLAVISVHRICILLALLAVGISLAVFSSISIPTLAKRIWLPVLAFTGIIALPAMFLIRGRPIFSIPLFWSATYEGLTSAALLVLRAEAAATFLVLIVLSTHWNHLLRALRFFRVPAVIVVILEMTQRYVFLLLETTRDMLESRQTRLIGYLRPAERRRLAVASVGVLLERSLDLTNEVHTAMQARGFRGNVYLLDDLHLSSFGWLHLTLFLCVAISAILLGR